jgi:hypothetical protein
LRRAVDRPLTKVNAAPANPPLYSRHHEQSPGAGQMVDSLNVDLETVCFIIFKAREFDAQEEALDEDPGSNPSDDGFREILASHADDQTYDEVKSLIDSLDWEEAMTTARERHNNRTAEYLLGIPLLPDLLQNALSEFGLSCADYEKEHL